MDFLTKDTNSMFGNNDPLKFEAKKPPDIEALLMNGNNGPSMGKAEIPKPENGNGTQNDEDNVDAGNKPQGELWL